MRQARQRQSQVWGVHGRGLSGFGQQVHLWPLSIPDPAARLISPGRRVVRRVTRCHRPWPVAGLRPTHQAGGHGPAGAALHIHRTPRRWGLPGTGRVGPAARRRNSRRTLPGADPGAEQARGDQQPEQDKGSPWPRRCPAPGRGLPVPLQQGLDDAVRGRLGHEYSCSRLGRRRSAPGHGGWHRGRVLEAHMEAVVQVGLGVETSAPQRWQTSTLAGSAVASR